MVLGADTCSQSLSAEPQRRARREFRRVSACSGRGGAWKKFLKIDEVETVQAAEFGRLERTARSSEEWLAEPRRRS